MISQLLLSNFKSIKSHTDVSLKPYTLIYGPNSAGKSSLIQSLLLLGQSSFDKVLFKTELLDLGTFTNAISGQVSGYNTTFKIGFSSASFGDFHFGPHKYKWLIEFEVGRNVLPGKDGLGKFKELNLTLSSSDKNARRATFKIAQEKILRIGGTNSSKWILTDPVLSDVSGGYPIIDPEQICGVMPIIFNSSKNATALCDHLGLPNQIDQNDLVRLKKSLSQPLEEIFDMAHVPPVRNIPPEVFLNDARMGKLNAYSFYNNLAKDAEALEDVNKALDRLEVKYKLTFNKMEVSALNPRVQGVGSFTLNPSDLKIRLGFQDVGYGVSQVVPVLAAVFSKKSLISIEQPELHLHPRLQGRLADILISAHKNNGSQFLIETHSESLMLRIQRKIREEEINPDDVKILYVNPDGNGFSSVSEIDLDENGNFTSEWPNGFFEERFDDIF